jgi:alpha-ketoglutarate-dependent taurine dioxygenase
VGVAAALADNEVAWTARPALPRMIEAPAGATAADLRALIAHSRVGLESLLLVHGALLFRGFGVVTAGELGDVVGASGGRAMRYVGGDSPRTALGGDVYTSTEVPRTVPIGLHNEMSYLARYPRHLWFCCAEEATHGGESTLADGRAIVRALDPRIRDRLAQNGIRYRRSLRGESKIADVVDRVANVKVTKSWMDTFESNDPRVAEERCRELGVRHTWLPSGRLVMENEGPAFVVHPITGERAWFNQAHLFKLSARGLGRLHYALARLYFLRPETRTHDARLGDGAELDATTLAHVFDVIDRNTRDVAMRRGDVLWIDNLLCMHGRRPFVGPRKILVSMTG